MLRIQRCLVPGSVFLAPELARVAGLSLCRMLPAGTSLHKVVPCTQSMGYIPGVWIYTECAHTAGCLYALKCVPTPKGMCAPEVWHMHQVWNILQNVYRTLRYDNVQHIGV